MQQPPSPSSSSSGSEAPDIPALRAAASSTNTLAAHLSLISALRATADLTGLRAAFSAASASHLLPQSVWLAHLAEESTLATTPDARLALLRLHTRALSHFSTPLLHARRLLLAASLLRHGQLSDPQYDAFLADADAHGAGYSAAFAALCGDLPRVPRILSPLPEHRVFESRLARTAAPSAGLATDDRIAAYLSCAHFAESFATAAIGVYEEALSEACYAPELWIAYDAFLARGNHPSREGVLSRARAVVPAELDVWQRSVAIADVSALMRLVDAVRKFVMASPDLAAACRLSKEVCNRFLALGCPPEARGVVDACLEFNVPESVEWASACSHAAAVVARAGETENAVTMMQKVVALRPEARWWLAHAALVDGEDRREVLERGLRSVGSVDEVLVMRDAWEVFEVSRGGEGLMQRMRKVADVALRREAERMNGAVERERHGKPAKRRRAERGKGDGAKEKGSAEAGGGKVAKARENGEEMEDKDGTTAERSMGMDDGTGSRDAKPGTKVVKMPQGGVEPKTIFLNNLPFSVTESHLQEEFAFAGAIKQIRLPKRSDGATKGLAYIEFGDEGAVVKALTKHNKPFMGRAMWVRRSKPPPKSRKGPRRGGPAFAVRGFARGGRRRLTVASRDADGEGEDAKDGDVVMGDGHGEKEGGLQQDDFRKLFLGRG